MEYLMSLTLIAATSVLGFLLHANGVRLGTIQIIYIFAVFLITRNTTGYMPGIICSVISMFLTNYFFVTPHYTFDLFENGNLPTTLCMLGICLLTSTMMTKDEVERDNQIKRVQERAQAEIEIERERTRANLLRSISHDLRTPLTAIAGCARTLMENNELLTKDQKFAMYAHICEDAERLIPMVENVLTITKVNGDLSLTKMEEAVEDIIASAVLRFKKHYPEIKIITETPKKVLLVPMDANLIVQVLLNVMMNSAEHGEKTTTIWVKAFQEGENAVFTIEDDGVGFSEEDRNHQAIDGKSKNLGIGLECCRTIVKAHGGTSGHWNREEGGAFTRVTLPLSRENNS